MQKENHDKTPAWKQKLEDATAEEAFGKDAAWDKLYIKMNQRPLKGKAMWYWLAAACTLFAIILSVSFYFQKNDATSEATLAHSASKNNASRTVTATIDNFIKNKNMLYKAIAVNKIISPKHKNKYLLKPNGKLRIQDNVILQTKNIIINKDILLIPDTLQKVLAVHVMKKKLPVIHINEIENAPNYQAEMAHNPPEHAFEIHFAAQQFFVNTSTGKSITQGFTILKSQTSSN